MQKTCSVGVPPGPGLGTTEISEIIIVAAIFKTVVAFVENICIYSGCTAAFYNLFLSMW